MSSGASRAARTPDRSAPQVAAAVAPAAAERAGALAPSRATEPAPKRSGDRTVADLLFASALAAELVHRQFHEVVKAILEETGHAEHIDASAAFLLVMIGDQEHDLAKVKKQGFYNKTNLTQVVAKMATPRLGYILRAVKEGDNRQVTIKATAKGIAVAGAVRHAFEDHVERVSALGLSAADLKGFNESGALLRTLSQSMLNLLQRGHLLRENS
jgi:hypothetical protein